MTITRSAPSAMSSATSRARLAAVRRVLLVGAPVADQRRVDRLPERPVERGGVLGRVGEDRRRRRARPRPAPRGRADLAVHHPGRADQVGAGIRLGDAPSRRSAPAWRRCRPRPSRVQHPAVAVVGELVQAQVGHQHEVVADLARRVGERDVEDAVRVGGLRADGVAGSAGRRTASGRRARRRPPGAASPSAIPGVLLDARHRADRHGARPGRPPRTPAAPAARGGCGSRPPARASRRWYASRRGRMIMHGPFDVWVSAAVRPAAVGSAATATTSNPASPARMRWWTRGPPPEDRQAE